MMEQILVEHLPIQFHVHLIKPTISPTTHAPTDPASITCGEEYHSAKISQAATYKFWRYIDIE